MVISVWTITDDLGQGTQVANLDFTNGTSTLYVGGTAVASASGTSSQLLAPVGAVGAPGLAWAADTDTGLYAPGANQVSVALSGTQRALFSGTQAQFSAGALAAPGVSFLNDTDSGIITDGTNRVAVVAGGTAVVRAYTVSGTGTFGVSYAAAAAGTGTQLTSHYMRMEGNGTTYYWFVGTTLA